MFGFWSTFHGWIHLFICLYVLTAQWLRSNAMYGGRKMNRSTDSSIWTYLQSKHSPDLCGSANEEQQNKKEGYIYRDMQNEILFGFHVYTHVWQLNWSVKPSESLIVLKIAPASTVLVGGCMMQVCIFHLHFVCSYHLKLNSSCILHIRTQLSFICLVSVVSAHQIQVEINDRLFLS